MMRAPRAFWPARGGRRLPGRRPPQDSRQRYGALLLLLILTYLLSASVISVVATELQTVLFFAVMLLALRNGQASRTVLVVVGGVALIGSVAALVAAASHTRGGEGGADIWKGLILLLTAVLIVRRVLARPTVTLQSIYGALSAYLIIGLMYAAFYAAIERLGGGSFFAHHQPANTQTFQYFSFTTLTTLGYGDFTALGNSGRALAVIEALTGQVFLATLVARLVAAFRSPAGRASFEAATTARRTRRRRLPGYAAQGSRMSYHRKPPATGRRPLPGPPRSQGPQEVPGRKEPPGAPGPPDAPGPPGPLGSAGDP
jgi:hypothetical protein